MIKFTVFNAGTLLLVAAMQLIILNFQPGLNNSALAKLARKKASVISCIPDRSELGLDNPENMVPLPGWGNYRWPFRIGSDSTDFYFNQGMNMYYSFHIVEAMASFQKAAILAPMDPMPQWGIALAYGPNINDVAYNYSPLALEAARKASTLASSSPDFVRLLTEAMLLRYSDDVKRSRADLDQSYATAMKAIYTKFPLQPDAGALYADALMLQHPWDLYEQNQQPKPWTPELVSVLEKVLAFSPNHPGANHYYIHAVEASKNPGRALKSADKLGGLLPMVSHMVHMPSHIYIRTGMYEKGIAVNKRAIDGYEAYKLLMPEVENGAFLYLMHNRHMQAASAMNNGDFQEAMLASEKLHEDIPREYLGSAPPEAEYMHYMYMSQVFTFVRFGKWQSLIAQPDLPDSFAFARILQSYGKSMAFSRIKEFKQSQLEIERIEQLLQLSSERLNIKMGAFNTAFAAGEVGLLMAKGILAEEQNRLQDAAQYLARAVQLEDQMTYNEPKDWILPPRQYLGAVLIKMGEYQKASVVFQEDLAFNPGNGWSLKGLIACLEHTGKNKDAEMLREQLKTVVKNRNFNPNRSVF